MHPINNVIKQPSILVPFGFLFSEIEVTFSNGTITPVKNFTAVAKKLGKMIADDGYLYPPPLREIRTDLLSDKQTIVRSKKIAHQFRLPASHQLKLSPLGVEDNVREKSAAFILYLLALLFETRLQFSDWLIDGRVSMHPDRQPIIASYPVILGNQISFAYEKWNGWKKEEQKRFLNILYLFSRKDVYEWDWEKFLFQYVILDACWKMGQQLLQFKAKRHSDRVKELYTYFNVYHPILDEIQDLAELRNDLFHEAAWHDGRPSHVGILQRKGCYDHAIALAWLNEGVIRLFLGIED